MNSLSSFPGTRRGPNNSLSSVLETVLSKTVFVGGTQTRTKIKEYQNPETCHFATCPFRYLGPNRYQIKRVLNSAHLRKVAHHDKELGAQFLCAGLFAIVWLRGRYFIHCFSL